MMHNLPYKTIPIAYGHDVYEVNYSRHGVQSILRFAYGTNAQGEEVYYDNLPQPLQDKIYNKLKEALKEDERDSSRG